MTRWSRSLTSDVDASAIEEGWRRIRARRERPRFARRALVAGPALAFAAIVALLLRAWIFAPQASLAPIALADGTELPAEWTTLVPLTVPFDDGSVIELAPRTQVTTRKSTPDRVELTVVHGRATFDVKPNGPRTWLVDAGDVRVTVLGTRFTVTRDRDEVEVTVVRGKVQVTSRRGTTILTAGQSFHQHAAPAPPPPLEAPETTETTLAPPATAAMPVAPRSVAPPTKHAPLSAETPAPSAIVTAPPVSDPLAEADALRRQGRSPEAVSVLRAAVEAGDERRALAAFTIGKIHAEDLRDPTGAARWFEKAIAFGLPAGLDEQAYARVVESWSQAGAQAEAARAAARYEARFPQGRHRAQVKGWAER